MLEQKKISSKINYDVLKDLNVKPGASPAQTPKKDSAASKIAPRQRRHAQAPLTLSTPLSTLGKRWVPSCLSESTPALRPVAMSSRFSAHPPPPLNGGFRRRHGSS